MKKYLFMAVVLVGLSLISTLSYARDGRLGSGSANAVSGAGISNPLGDGVQSVESFVSKGLSFVVKIGAVFAVLALIYAGFLYVQARGNSGALTKAHTTLRNTIIGIVLLLGAQLIASIITGTIEALKK